MKRIPMNTDDRSEVLSALEHHDAFIGRHIGTTDDDQRAMLRALGFDSRSALIDAVVPPAIREPAPLALPQPMHEAEALARLKSIAAKNRAAKSFIGQGYYGTHTPAVIQRNVLENPAWYTAYTPYQPEISQGRLEALLNFQTMVADLTGMAIANASLLDEATAAAEAMTLLHRVQTKRIDAAAAAGAPPQFLVADGCFPQTIEVLRARAEPLGIELSVVPWRDLSASTFGDRVFGVLVQTPDEAGRVHDLREFIGRARRAGVLVAVGTDLLSATLLVPPGEQGADVVFGNSQRFGV